MLECVVGFLGPLTAPSLLRQLFYFPGFAELSVDMLSILFASLVSTDIHQVM